MRKNKIILLFLVMMLLCNFVLFNDVAKADSVYSLDYGWESEIIGSNNGTSGLIDYEEGEHPTWAQIDNSQKIDTRSFKITEDYDTSPTILSWWNLTTDFNYISTFGFRFYLNDDSGNLGFLWMNFYKDDVLTLKIGWDVQQDDMIYYDNIGVRILDSSWNDYDETWCYLNITHIDTNLMNYSIYNETNVLQAYVQDNTIDNSEWTNFNRITFTHQSGGALDELYVWFDDFNITTSAGASGWETCQGGTFVVTKLFYDSIGYYNDTLSFTIQKNLLATGYYGIYNSTDSLIQSSSFNSQTFPTWYFVEPQYGTGTYYMKVGYEFGTWLVSCPFTILTSTSDIADWNVRFDKSSYNIGDEVDLFVKIPSGEIGYVNITLEESGETYFYKSYNNIYGTGNEIKFDNIFHIYNNDYCLNAWLYNDTNDVLMKHYVACVPVDIDYWTLYLDGEFTTSINNGDSVRIEGNHHYDNGYVRFMNDTDPVNGTIFSQIEIGTGDYLFNYDKFVNTSVGVERFYVYLYCDNNYLIDGIIRYIDVYDEDVLTPFTDEGWYGLPFWVQYLIGIFLTLFITMSPLIIGTYISRNTRMTKVSIPPLLYVGFFFFGLIVSVLMDFLPSWLPFVILFGMITFFAVQWLYGKKGEIAGE